jgi:multiple sugar transport system ATP-binding protein
MTALQLENVCKSFGAVEVLKDISLQVDDGEFVVFVGPSGCGKSTLLRVIAGLEQVSSGTVTIDGEVVNNTPPAKRGIAMVFQSYALYPHLRVRGNLSLGLKQEKQPTAVITSRVEKAAKMLALDDYLERFPTELSGGQRQRVAIGRAIVREPKLFLFDEPLSNLDAALRVSTRFEIATLHRSLNASIIYVTHDQTEAMTLADRIVVLRDGKVEQIGTPMELYNAPANQFVAGFLGSPAMNFLKSSLPSIPPGHTFGLRPEHLRIAHQGRINGTISHIERLGADTNLLIRTDTGEALTLRHFGQYENTVGNAISLDFDDSDSFLFDEAGQRI